MTTTTLTLQLARLLAAHPDLPEPTDVHVVGEHANLIMMNEGHLAAWADTLGHPVQRRAPALPAICREVMYVVLGTGIEARYHVPAWASTGLAPVEDAA